MGNDAGTRRGKRFSRGHRPAVRNPSVRNLFIRHREYRQHGATLESPRKDEIHKSGCQSEKNSGTRGTRPAGVLKPNSEVDRKERREHKEGEGFGQHSRRTISHAALSVQMPSLCVLCDLCGYSISEFGLKPLSRKAPPFPIDARAGFPFTPSQPKSIP